MPNKNKNVKIVFSGGSGRFGTVLKKIITGYNILYPKKNELNIKNINSILKYLKKHKPTIFIHAAGLSRPMSVHEDNINKSINLNIISTANVVIACKKLDIKLVYISTNFVYPGIKGNFKEVDPVKPFNNYGWSKLGGEASVQMYKNSLILRTCMTEEPFVHKKAFGDVLTNFEYHRKIGEMLFRLIHEKGIINLGGKSQSVYEFAKEKNLTVKKISAKKIFGKNYPIRQDMSISKLKKILKR
tara:strand:+ start:6094 stop:6822 length:729 start_codon:yes stop_codon:yes gene_type:complete